MALGETIGQLFGKSRGKQTLLTLGENALLRGRGDEAEARFQAILETYPEHRRARMGLMEAWLCQGKSDLVLDTYDKLSAQEKTIFDDQFLLALSLQVGSLKRDGYLRWLQTPRQGSDRHAAIAHLAKTFAKCGIFSIHWAESAIRRLEFQEAEQALRQMRDAQPPLSEERVSALYAKRDAVLLKDHPEVVHLLEECQALDEPHERLRRLEPVAIKHMSIAALQHDTGVAFFDCGQPEAGIRFLSRAVGCNPYWVNAWLNLGRVSLAAERYVRARDAFQRILMLFEFSWVRDVYGNIDDFISNHPERPHVEAGLDRAQNGDYYGAAESFRVALTHNPDAPSLIFLLAHALFETANYTGALSYLKTLVQIDDDSISAEEKETWRQLLEVCTHQCVRKQLNNDEADKAVELLEDVLSLLPSLHALREERQLVKRVLDDELQLAAFDAYEQAHACYEDLTLEARLEHVNRAIELQGDFVEAYIAKAVWLSEQGELEYAFLALEEAERLRPDSCSVSFHKASIAFLRQETEQAMALWQACVDAGQAPWSEAAGRNIEALSSSSMCQMVLAILPQHRRVSEFAPPGMSTSTVSPQPAVNKAPLKPISNDLFEIPLSNDSNPALPPEKVRELIKEQAVPTLSQVNPLDELDGPSSFADLKAAPQNEMLHTARTQNPTRDFFEDDVASNESNEYDSLLGNEKAESSPLVFAGDNFGPPIDLDAPSEAVTPSEEPELVDVPDEPVEDISAPVDEIAPPAFLDEAEESGGVVLDGPVEPPAAIEESVAVVDIPDGLFGSQEKAEEVEDIPDEGFFPPSPFATPVPETEPVKEERDPEEAEQKVDAEDIEQDVMATEATAEVSEEEATSAPSDEIATLPAPTPPPATLPPPTPPPATLPPPTPPPASVAPVSDVPATLPAPTPPPATLPPPTPPPASVVPVEETPAEVEEEPKAPSSPSLDALDMFSSGGGGDDDLLSSLFDAIDNLEKPK